MSLFADELLNCENRQKISTSAVKDSSTVVFQTQLMAKLLWQNCCSKTMQAQQERAISYSYMLD